MAEPLSRIEWRRRRKRKVIILRTVVFGTAAILLALLIYLIYSMLYNIIEHEQIGTITEVGNKTVYVDMLTESEYSRPGNWMSKSKVDGIVLHTFDKAGATALARRNSYELLATSKTNHLSCHFIVGIDGEIVQCVPVNEIALASGSRNKDTIAIEYCYESDAAVITDDTYESLVELAASLVNRFKLTESQIYRHKDVTEIQGESAAGTCPPAFDNDEVWNRFKNDVMLKAANLKK